MSVELIEVLLLHVGRVEQLELVTEQGVVSGFELFDEVKSLHLDERCLEVGAHMVAVRLKDEGV